MQVLARRSKNNPILLGDPGVGKTAIAEGLARAIVTGQPSRATSKTYGAALWLATLCSVGQSGYLSTATATTKASTQHTDTVARSG